MILMLCDRVRLDLRICVGARTCTRDTLSHTLHHHLTHTYMHSSASPLTAHLRGAAGRAPTRTAGPPTTPNVAHRGVKLLT